MRTVRQSSHKRVAKCQRVTIDIHGVWSVPLVWPETANNARRENRVEPNAEKNRKKRGEIRMEAVEFLRNYNRMCSIIDKCSECPAVNMKCCELYTDEQAKLVEIVEKWAKEHPEKPEQEQQKPEKEQQKPEHPEEAADVTKQKQDEPCVKTIQDNLEGAIYRAIDYHKNRIENLEYEVSVIRHDLAALHDKTYALSEKVDRTPTMEPNKTPKQKRTNKDVLLAVLPNVDTSACPKVLDMNYKCDKRKLCAVCKHEFWNADTHIDLRRLRNDSTFMV